MSTSTHHQASDDHDHTQDSHPRPLERRNSLSSVTDFPVDVVEHPTEDTAADWCTEVKFILTAYFFASLATCIKTVAWWFNQWPFASSWNFFGKWAVSASIAGCEYAPLTYSFGYATEHGVHLSLMTAYMEAADNAFRMFQQLALGDTLAWFDWLAAGLLALFVVFQGIMHWRHETAPKSPKAAPAAVSDVDSSLLTGEPKKSSWTMGKTVGVIVFLAAFSAGCITGSLFGGYTGQAYTLATVATGAKTFAWWINQYPLLRNASFFKKWMAGWSIAACIEYLPLMGAFTIASDHGVHLGLMTAFMEALDNAFRIAQQFMLGKPLYWFDYLAAFGMFCAVIFQGIMRFLVDHNDL